MFDLEAHRTMMAGVISAEEGDYTLIVARLMNPDISLSMIERECIAKILKPEKGTKARVSAWKVASAKLCFQWLVEVERWQKDAAKSSVKERLGMSKRSVHDYLSIDMDEFSRSRGTAQAALVRAHYWVKSQDIARAARDELSEEEFKELHTQVCPPVCAKK